MQNTLNSRVVPKDSKPIENLASELGVEIEALEERLEMVGIEALACCSINLLCKPN
jgi:hypothetical protein